MNKKSSVPTFSTTGKRMSPLTAFAMRPAGVRFETQEAEETVILFLRQHMIVNLGWIVVAILLVLSPGFIFPMIINALGLVVTVPASYIVIGTLFWYVGTLGFVLAKFLGWYFNIYIVTNERVVDIDFYYLLYKQFSQAELPKIQDISYASGGILATFFNYGNVAIQTAGEMPNLEFQKVPFPEKVVETIRNLTELTE
jgi:hypothetical protein